MERNEQQIKSCLQRTSDILLINGGLLDNPGLFTGEMGLALFFLRYSRFSQNEIYEEYSSELIEKVQNNIHDKTPIDYKQGLTGIGSAIEYLVQHNYIEADTDDLLEAFDKKILSLENLPFLSIEELFGIGYYALWRMKTAGTQQYTIIKTIIPALVSAMEERCKNLRSTYSTVKVLKELIESENPSNLKDFVPIPQTLRLCRNSYPYGLDVKTYQKFMDQLSKDDTSKQNMLDLGLQNGLAGFGMSLMTALDSDDSWVYLIPSDLIYLKNEPLPL